jgi:peptide/nickel transport system permease protein
MLRQIARRLALGIGIVLVVVTLTFILISLAPGDPARLWVAPGAGEAELEAARRALGLDRPLIARYASWLANFTRGDWGVTVGVVQAIKRRTALDTGLTVGTLLVYGMPAYWLAIMLVLVFAYSAARYDWPVWLQFPAMGVASLDADFLTPWGRLVDRLRHLTLPLLTLGAIGAAGTARYVRGAVLDVRANEFVRTARAKGLPSLTVELRHVLRNALMPVVTLLGLTLPALFSGTVFVEVIFAWPGMGRVMVDAVGARDYPVVMATTAIFAVLVVVGNLLADLLYAWVDPRLRRAS